MSETKRDTKKRTDSFDMTEESEHIVNEAVKHTDKDTFINECIRRYQQ